MAFKIVDLEYNPNNHEFFNYLSDLLKEEFKTNSVLILNFEKIVYVSSNILALLANHQKQKDKEIKLINVNKDIMKVLELCQFTEFFDINSNSAST